MNPETFDYISEKKFLPKAGNSLCCLYPKPSAYTGWFRRNLHYFV